MRFVCLLLLLLLVSWRHHSEAEKFLKTHIFVRSRMKTQPEINKYFLNELFSLSSILASNTKSSRRNELIEGAHCHRHFSGINLIQIKNADTKTGQLTFLIRLSSWMNPLRVPLHLIRFGQSYAPSSGTNGIKCFYHYRICQI